MKNTGEYSSSIHDTTVATIATSSGAHWRHLPGSGLWKTINQSIPCVLFSIGLVRIRRLRSVLSIAEPWDEGDGKKWDEMVRRPGDRPGLLGSHPPAWNGGWWVPCPASGPHSRRPASKGRHMTGGRRTTSPGLNRGRWRRMEDRSASG